VLLYTTAVPFTATVQAAIENLISSAKSTAAASSAELGAVIDPVLIAPPPPSAPPTVDAEVESGEITSTEAAAVSSSGYLSLLSEEDAVDEAGEKLLLSEIGKFRTRQLQRDKEVEEQRKMKIKAKMMELKVSLPPFLSIAVT